MSIAYVVDGETDLDSALFNPIIAGINVQGVVVTTPAELVSTVMSATAGDRVILAPGTFTLSSMLFVPAGVDLAARDARTTRLVPSADFPDEALVSLASQSGVYGVGFDGGMHATCGRGAQIAGNGTVKDCRIADCYFANFAGAAVWTWTTNGVWVERNTIRDSVIGIQALDADEGGGHILDNDIRNNVAGRMQYGILGNRGSSGPTQSTLMVGFNYVEGADYATSNGAQSHGISLFRSPNAIVFSNKITRCGNAANGLGAGILFAGESEGAVANSNHVWDCESTGIFFEVDGVNTDIDTVSGKRGAVGNNNTVHDCKVGIAVSYSAGSTVIANNVYDNEQEGIVVDSDFCDVSHNHVYNNWRDSGADAPPQNDGRKAGIRGYGAYGTYTGNHVFDNQDTPTQTVAMAVESKANIIALNQLRGTDALYENGGGTANTKSGNVEQNV